MRGVRVLPWAAHHSVLHRPRKPRTVRPPPRCRTHRESASKSRRHEAVVTQIPPGRRRPVPGPDGADTWEGPHVTETLDSTESAPAKKRAGGLNAMFIADLKSMAGGL